MKIGGGRKGERKKREMRGGRGEKRSGEWEKRGILKESCLKRKNFKEEKMEQRAQSSVR